MIYPQASSKETTNDTLFKTYYIKEGYYVDFAELILECMTKVYNLSRNFPLPYFNLLTHIFKAFNVSVKEEGRLDTQIP